MTTVSTRPRVRLSKLVVPHVRAVEVMRYLKAKKGTCRVDHADFFVEMARRGMLDPTTAIVRMNGASMPTESVKATMNIVTSFCLDLELIEHAYPGDRKRFHVYTLTRDGLETLRDWDDTTADGLWSRP